MTTLEPLAVETAPLTGVTLIEASAGTGKTYTIATLYLRLLLEAELSLPEILVVTYTRAATAELRLRIRARLGEALSALEGHETTGTGDSTLQRMAACAHANAQAAGYKQRLVDALRSFDEAAIFTIHGFCRRVLKKHAFESGAPFEAELREDQGLLVEEIVCDYWAAKLSDASEQFVAALSNQSLGIDQLVQLVKRAASNPELIVLPEASGALPPTAALETELAAAGARVAELWREHAGEVKALLARAGLNQTSYGPGRLQVVFDLLPYAARLTASKIPSRIELLTPEGLRSKCNKGHVAPSHALFDACEVWLKAAKALCHILNAQIVEFQRELLEYARAEVAQRSEQAGSLGFDDLLAQLSAALNGAGGSHLIEQIRVSHRAALIDEFQDTDPLQCDVFRRIYATHVPNEPEGSLFLIGDPKQAIYAFRGADVFAYMAAARSGVDRGFTLSVNRRSDPGLLRGVDAIFSRAQLPFVFPEIAYRSVSAAPDARDRLHGAGAPFSILFMPRAADQKTPSKRSVESLLPKRIAAEIAQLLQVGADIDGEPLEARHIAVLARTNRQAQEVQSALRDLGIAAVLDGDASVFDSPMAEELARFLWALCEPGDAARVRAALATSGIGLDAKALLSLEADEPAWDAWVGRFHTLHELWQTHGFMRALHTLCDELGVAARLLALPDGERRYTDLMHLGELLHAEALQSRKGPRALLDWYRRLRMGDAQRVGMTQQDAQIRLESDAHAVTLTTIHKSKGLQFPIVYCPFVSEGALLRANEKKSPQFHDRNNNDRLTLILGSGEKVDSEYLDAAEREALAEQLRLLYVALTRAKHQLTIVWGAVSDFECSALAYLLHQAPDADGQQDLQRSTAERTKQLADTELLADLERLRAAAGGAIEIRVWDADTNAGDYAAQRSVSCELTARVSERRAADSLQVSSFSRLAAGEQERHDASEGLDRDEQDDASAAPESSSALPNRIPLADFPAGASFGHLIHAIYETADFQVTQPSELQASVADALRDFGAAAAGRRSNKPGVVQLTAVDWSDGLATALFDTLRTPLSADRSGLPMLASVAMSRRLSELEFLFPVANELSASPLSAARLAQVLVDHARNPGEQAYARRLGGLRFPPLRGFLRGFVDLIAEHEGRFYVLDYKSNHLGPSASDYQTDRLGSVMRRHHYVLQYLVYSVALHRYLTLRLRDYDYDLHFGGVYYLFVRGMSREHAPGTGVFFDRPERALIERLSLLFDQGASS